MWTLSSSLECANINSHGNDITHVGRRMVILTLQLCGLVVTLASYDVIRCSNHSSCEIFLNVMLVLKWSGLSGVVLNKTNCEWSNEKLSSTIQKVIDTFLKGHSVPARKNKRRFLTCTMWFVIVLSCDFTEAVWLLKPWEEIGRSEQRMIHIELLARLINYWYVRITFTMIMLQCSVNLALHYKSWSEIDNHWLVWVSVAVTRRYLLFR